MSEPSLAPCGQLIGVGFDGLTAPANLLRRIADGRLGWVILFARNVESPGQVARLCASLQEAAPPDRPLGIAVDQEGGRVRRLRAPWPDWPAARVLGRGADWERCARVGEAMGAELRACGIHLDLAPVLDVDTNPDNPVIGDRAFGRDVDTVVQRAGAFADGLQRAGIAACGKHFPGHGDTHLDSHTDLPVVTHDRARLREVELAPFAALAPRLPALMSAHVVFPAWDAERPATLSPALVQGLLREELGFEGVVFSDDMEMKAVADHHPPERLAIQSVEAGVDVISNCHDPARQERMLSALVRRCREDATFARRVEAAAARVATLKSRWIDPAERADAHRAEETARDPAHHRLAASLVDP